MYINFFITSNLDSDRILEAVSQVKNDIENEFIVKQIFFYSDAVEIASLECYPQCIKDLINIADNNDIPLYVCSAGFQKRQLKITNIAKQDFSFKGLGQFIAESKNIDFIRNY